VKLSVKAPDFGLVAPGSNKIMINRRRFLYSTGVLAAAGIAIPAPDSLLRAAEADGQVNKARIRFGLVTYMWGFDWKLPELLSNCEKAGAEGVELRTGHAHGVDPELSPAGRREAKQRFADSPISLVGLGSNEDFHDVDSGSLAESIERAKSYIRLSHDVGGMGVKVKPNDLPSEVAQQKTVEQIGKALNQLGAYAADYGQQLRLEVHGQCSLPTTIASIMEVADHPNVAVCWNSNPQDLNGEGLKHNFNLLKHRLGATVHARQLDGDEYPYAELFALLIEHQYKGWLLIEAGDMPADRVAALARERKAFEKLVSS
jgi:sugar phosphate isomerase/epimerase